MEVVGGASQPWQDRYGPAVGPLPSTLTLSREPGPSRPTRLFRGSMATLTGRIQSWEILLLTRVAEWGRAARPVRVALWLTRSGDGPAYVLVPIALAALDPTRALSLLLLCAAAFAVERVLYASLKRTLRRPRPFERVQGVQAHVAPPDRFSFPSGHTSAAFLVAVLVGSLHPLAAAPFLLWAAAVGVSRVCLGVHYPSDVVAGAFLGGAVARLAFLFFLS
jgi:undecaprenyl-diphosphatase